MLPFIIYAQSEKRIKTTCTENISAVHGIPPGRSDQTLWYDEPAAQWEETLPLGNGRLGMMPDGAIDRVKSADCYSRGKTKKHKS